MKAKEKRKEGRKVKGRWMKENEGEGKKKGMKEGEGKMDEGE